MVASASSQLFVRKNVLSLMSTSMQQRFSHLYKKNSVVPSVRSHKAIVNKYCTDGKIHKSPYADVIIPKVSLTEYVFENVEQHADLPCATCASAGRSYTYGMMMMMTTKFAKSLIAKCHLKTGDTLAMVSPNIPEFMVAVHGILTAGLKVTFINPLFTPEEITRQFINAGINMVVTIPHFLDMAIMLSPHLKNFKGIICIGGDDDEAKKVFGFRSLIMGDYEANLPKIDIESTALLPYSSGTSGLPKGVCLSHSNLVANLAQIRIPELYDYKYPTGDKNVTLFTALPFFHIYGFNPIMNVGLMTRMHIITLPRFKPEEFVRALEVYKPEQLFVVPSLLLFLVTHPLVTKKHLASIKSIISGASPITNSLVQWFQKKVKNPELIVRQGYGMTETSPVLTMTPLKNKSGNPETVGVLIPNTLGKIMNLDTRKILGPDKRGELFVKGPQVMKGYLNNKKATDEILDKDGWLHTGDVGYYDKNDYFFVVDRSKELIKVSGRQVSPTELENVVLEYPGGIIEDVAVIGIENTQSGEVPKAFVVLKPNAKLSEAELLKFVNPKVAKYKRIISVQFVESIPRSISGKILRNELKKIHLNHPRAI